MKTENQIKSEFKFEEHEANSKDGKEGVLIDLMNPRDSVLLEDSEPIEILEVSHRKRNSKKATQFHGVLELIEENEPECLFISCE